MFSLLFFSLAFSNPYTVHIQGAGTFQEYAPIYYQDRVLIFTQFTCVRADDGLFDDGLETRAYFRAGNNTLHPFKVVRYDLNFRLDVEPLYPVRCVQNPQTLEDLEKVRAALTDNVEALLELENN